MIKEITVSDMNTGRDAVISLSGQTAYVLDSVDWGTPNVSFDDFRVPGQIGTTKLDAVVGTRTISITGIVLPAYEPEKKLGMNWEEYYKQKEEAINENKKILNNIINPFHDITLVAGGCFITGSPATPVKYSIDDSENNEVMCKFNFDLQCFKPLFKKTVKSEMEKINRTKMFKFPMKLYKNKTKFGEITTTGTFYVQNNGDVDSGGIITILASGGNVINPTVFNVTTEERIKVNMTLKEGEKLVIDTLLGERDITKVGTDGRVEGQIQNMSDSSVMFDFVVGNNSVICSGDSGTVSFMNVTFNVDENYFNIEGQ